jgi:multicomponent Na+:H+ antiporter subunit B
MKTTARVVVPIILVVAISLLLQGHNYPGGGFIAGVLTVVAVTLVYVAYGLDYIEVTVLNREVDTGTGAFDHRTVVDYRRTLIAGLAIAVASGLVAVAFGEPFLSQTFREFEGVPVYHKVKLASTLVFDLGVYAVVVGGLLTILSVVSGE